MGTGDGRPHGNGVVPQFFWQWTPINLPSRSVFFHINADAHGSPWNTRAVIAPDGAGHDGFTETPSAKLDAPLQPGTLWPAGGTLTVGGGDEPLTLTLEPLVRFQMRGLGYTSPTWGHGLYHGVLDVAREDIVLADVDPKRMDNFHVQLVCLVTTSAGEVGTGVFEQRIFGAYAALVPGGGQGERHPPPPHTPPPHRPPPPQPARRRPAPLPHPRATQRHRLGP